MKDFVIDVGLVEEYQMINDVQELETIFQRAKSALVCGAKAVLARKDSSGKLQSFDILAALTDLEQYKTRVFKYLKTE